MKMKIQKSVIFLSVAYLGTVMVFLIEYISSQEGLEEAKKISPLSSY